MNSDTSDTETNHGIMKVLKNRRLAAGIVLSLIIIAPVGWVIVETRNMNFACEPNCAGAHPAAIAVMLGSLPLLIIAYYMIFPEIDYLQGTREQ